MKMVLFSPTIQTSQVAATSKRLIQHLIPDHEVTLIQTEHPSLQKNLLHPFDVPIIPWQQVGKVNKAVSAADALVYQIGDELSLYEGTLKWLPYFPGIVYLQDKLLNHLFSEWQSSHPKIAALLKTQFTLDIDNTDHCCRFSPLIHWISLLAQGIIVQEDCINHCMENICPVSVDCESLHDMADEKQLIRLIETCAKKNPSLTAIQFFCQELYNWSPKPLEIQINPLLSSLHIFDC